MQNKEKWRKKFYQESQEKGFEVVVDDREFSAGYKFSEADLIGFPLQVIVGEKMSQEGKIEVKVRKNDQRWEAKKRRAFHSSFQIKGGTGLKSLNYYGGKQKRY